MIKDFFNMHMSQAYIKEQNIFQLYNVNELIYLMKKDASDY